MKYALARSSPPTAACAGSGTSLFVEVMTDGARDSRREFRLRTHVPVAHYPRSSSSMGEAILFAPAEDEPMTPEEVVMLVEELGGYLPAAREISCDATTLANYARGLRAIPRSVVRSLREACQ